VTLRARWVTLRASLGDAESSLGDTKSSLGDAKSSLGDAKSSLGEGTRAVRYEPSTECTSELQLRFMCSRRAKLHMCSGRERATEGWCAHPSLMVSCSNAVWKFSLDRATSCASAVHCRS
jgi:hypothetical protein